MIFQTNDGTAVQGTGYERMRIRSTGFVEFSSPGAIAGQTAVHPGSVRITAVQNDCRLILNTIANPGYSAIAFYENGSYLAEIGANDDGIAFYDRAGGGTVFWITQDAKIWMGMQIPAVFPTYDVEINGNLNVRGNIYRNGVLVP
jgi:hypothetical protein